MNADKLDKIKKKLETKPLLSDIFLLTISKNPHEQLEFFDAKQLIQPYYRKSPPFVIGMAKSYQEAMDLVLEIVSECLETRGDCSLKEYLK